jgi:hypothetical protein
MSSGFLSKPYLCQAKVGKERTSVGGDLDALASQIAVKDHWRHRVQDPETFGNAQYLRAIDRCELRN